MTDTPLELVMSEALHVSLAVVKSFRLYQKLSEGCSAHCTFHPPYPDAMLPPTNGRCLKRGVLWFANHRLSHFANHIPGYYTAFYNVLFLNAYNLTSTCVK